MAVINTTVGQMENTNDTTPGGPTGCVIWCDMDIQYGLFIFRMLTVIVQPILSLVGIFGNIATMMVLKRQGLKRSTNILLFSLAIADFLYLFGLNDARQFYEVFPSAQVSLWGGKVLYGCTIFQGAMLEVGNACTVWIASFITMERIVAVYLPLKFNSIVRPRRVCVALAILFAYSVLSSIVMPFEVKMVYNNKTRVMDVDESYRKLKYKYFFETRFEVHNYLVGSIPICIVTLGCFLIGFKVRQANIARAKMLKSDSDIKKPGTDSPPRASRTTKTLLIVCICFVLTIGPAFGIQTFYEFNWTVLQVIFAKRVIYIFYVINSSCNFFIYTISNEKFRDTFLEIYPCFQKVFGITPKDKTALQKHTSMGG